MRTLHGHQCSAGVVGTCYRSPVDDDATDPMNLITMILRFHHILEARLDRALNGCGLSFAQYEVMEVLAAEPKLHAGELGRRLHIARQSAHGLLKQLERAGLIELLPRDGAIRCAWLTRAGARASKLAGAPSRASSGQRRPCRAAPRGCAATRRRRVETLR